MSRAVRFLLFASLGPITGPLAAGLARALSEGRHAMAGVYGLAIVEAWVVMGTVGVHLASMLGIRLS